MNNFGFNIFGYFEGGFGLAIAAKHFVKAIENKIPFALKNISNEFQIQEKGNYQEKPLEYSVNIYFINADEIKSVRNKYLNDLNKPLLEIGVWFWELEEFPEFLHSSFSVLDEIWVCSDYIYNNLKEISPIPVFRMPYPWFSNISYPSYLSNEYSSFNFLTVFDYRSDYYRKNPEGVIKAFKKAFTENEEVTLVIKSINFHEFPKTHERLKNQVKDDKRIKLIDQRISRAEMNKIFFDARCFVSLHRAEGLGLNILDAADNLKPIIVTDYGGNRDFINKEYCECIGYRKTTVKAETEFLSIDNCSWAEPNIESAALAMKKIYTDFPKYKKKTILQKEFQKEYLSPNKTINWLNKRIESLKVIEPSIKKSYSLIDIIRDLIDENTEQKILITGTAPLKRVEEVCKVLMINNNLLRLDYFGRENKLNFHKKYIYYDMGMFQKDKIKTEIIENIKNNEYDMVIVLLMNYYGYNYNNIKDITSSFKAKKVVALGKENDCFYW